MNENELEHKILECPSPIHKDVKLVLDGFKYVDRKMSSYYFCYDCKSFYELRNNILVQLYEEDLAVVPLLFDKDNKQVDPYDLIEDDEF